MFFKNIYNKIFSPKSEYKLKKKINLFKNSYEKIIFENNNLLDAKSEINFLHSGTSGDLIYALAVINKISLTRKCNFYINVNKK